MISVLFRFLGLVFFVWLIRRLLSYFMGAPKGNRAKERSAAPPSQMVKDPVCGMYLDSRLAVRMDRKSEEFYFCSEECRQKYLTGSAAAGASGSEAPR